MPGSLDVMLRAQQRGCHLGGSPLYAHLLERIRADVAAGGPSRAVLERFADEPVAAAVALRFLAAVHELVLDGSAPELAGHYPSVGGQAGPDVADAFLAVVAAHAARIAELTAVPLQTNEVGRSASLLGGHLLVAATWGLPLRVLEVGASAGLNLRFDLLRYEAGRASFGPVGSPVRFVEPWAGRAPPLDVALVVAERRGCDLRPLDPTTPPGQMRLRACLWPDQPVRRRRLEGALQVAAEVPVVIDRADGPGWVAEQLARPTPGRATVVTHSVVTQYLSAASRRALEGAIREAGRRATADAPLAWLSMEPGGHDEAEVRLTCWPGPPTSRVVARSAFHGPPVRWTARRG